MNTFAKLVAPAALVLAAFGANASEIAPGDVGARGVVTVGSSAAPSVTPVAAAKNVAVGEVAIGDLGTLPVTRGNAPTTARPQMAEPIRSPMVIGA